MASAEAGPTLSERLWMESVIDQREDVGAESLQFCKFIQYLSGEFLLGPHAKQQLLVYVVLLCHTV